MKAGLEPRALYEAIRTGAAGRMRSFDQVKMRFLQGRLDPPSFALRLLQKDVALTHPEPVLDRPRDGLVLRDVRGHIHQASAFGGPRDVALDAGQPLAAERHDMH